MEINVAYGPMSPGKDVLLSQDNTGSPVNKILRLLACADQLNNGVKHLCTVRLLLLFKNKHKVMTKACLHHDPVNRTSQVNVSCQENNVFTCTCQHNAGR